MFYFYWQQKFYYPYLLSIVLTRVIVRRGCVLSRKLYLIVKIIKCNNFIVKQIFFHTRNNTLVTPLVRNHT